MTGEATTCQRCHQPVLAGQWWVEVNLATMENGKNVFRFGDRPLENRRMAHMQCPQDVRLIRPAKRVWGRKK